MKLTANRLNPLFLPVFPLPMPASLAPLKRKNIKCRSETEGRNDLPVFLPEYIQQLQVTPLEILKSLFSRSSSQHCLFLLAFFTLQQVQIYAPDQGLFGKLSVSWPSCPLSTNVASKPVFSLVHSQK